jgi:Ca2+-binding EF-hand superfamily protein
MQAVDEDGAPPVPQIDVEDSSNFLASDEVKARIDEMEAENSVLEAIHADASLLVHFEKQDNPSHVEHVLSKRSYDIDVAKIRSQMEHRIKQYKQPVKQVKKRDYRRRTNANYLALLKEQDDDIKKRDESMRKYYEFSTKCIERELEAATHHSHLGEFRDDVERHLKTRMMQLVGIVADTIIEDISPRQEKPTHLGVPSQSVQRRYSDEVMEFLDREVEQVVKTADENSDGLLSEEELVHAVHNKAGLSERMKVLAFNLMMFRENREQMGRTAPEDEERLQKVLDDLASSIDVNGDGYISADEMRALPPEVKLKLHKAGIPVLM